MFYGNKGLINEMRGCCGAFNKEPMMHFKENKNQITPINNVYKSKKIDAI